MAHASLPMSKWYFELVFDYGEHRPGSPTPDDHAAVASATILSPRTGRDSRSARTDCASAYSCSITSRRAGRRRKLPGSLHRFHVFLRRNASRRAQSHLTRFCSRSPSRLQAQAGGGYLSNRCRRWSSSTPAAIDEDVRRWTPKAWRTCPTASTARTTSGSIWTAKGSRHPDRAGGGLVLQTQSESDQCRGADTARTHVRPASRRSSVAEQALARGLHGESSSSSIWRVMASSTWWCSTADARFLRAHAGDGLETFPAIHLAAQSGWSDPNFKFVDLTVTAMPIFSSPRTTPSLVSLAGGSRIWPGRTCAQAGRGKGPALVFADATESIYLADMSGDGLTDLVRVRNGEMCYWPNLVTAVSGPRSPWTIRHGSITRPLQSIASSSRRHRWFRRHRSIYLGCDGVRVLQSVGKRVAAAQTNPFPVE